ncbi:(2Fe-2S)-binding protein [Haloprofundus marisrubri]|uniref:(2Fe-2S)-binding protein n=1 Tax=Haloprofundus marisrubri TaxID=1514971 RepID=A0A0W1R5L2_9EURY|nr:Rieske 2Fe-2S domain-containing protein [Haloprofundus marisrubri]KTG08540.1 (2Fe-2S)-binding protein [Haloprofundus marisrubri]
MDDDAIRVTVETDDGEETVRIYDTEGSVEVDDATFRFSVDDDRLASDADDATSTPESDNSTATDDPDDEPDTDDARLLAAVDDVPERGTLRFEAIHGQRGAEGILERSGDDVYAWRNSCPHKPHVRLDPGFGARTTDDHIVCHEHGARFVRGDGFCTRGPCRGQSLDPIEVECRDGDVYLVDERFESGRRL